ncbi:DUF998 domain-containing protein [Actinomadura sp. 7K507]|uniref:DUF998 domain-containing protein n=1 Tax=Actinomadura sp. 7K507 TaxID=2530365 RepID=UPI001FB5D0C7|nr:DUF998 domain-containing protein [Actinomadura sp. 7K507]
MDSDERDGPGTVPAPVIVLAVVATITYTTFLLAGPLDARIDFADGYVSELSAADQPFRYVYSAGDLVTGVLIILVALGALWRLKRRPLTTAGWVCLGMFGVFAIGDAVFPLDCAPSLDTSCALRERSGHLSFSHGFHAFTSSSVITCWMAALLLLSSAARRYGWWPALARWGRPLVLVQLAFVAGVMASMYVGQWLGVVQRGQITVLCLGVLLIAWALYTDRRDAAHGAPDVSPTREGARS